MSLGSKGPRPRRSKVHQSTSAPFRARSPGPASGRFPVIAAWRGSRVVTSPVAFRQPASASWTSCPAEGLRPSRDRPTRLQGRDPDGVSTFRAYEMRPGRTPPKPRDQRCSHDRRGRLRSSLAASSSGQVLSPGIHSVSPGLSMTRHHRGFTRVRPSGLLLARLLPLTDRGPLGFFPELRTFDGQDPRTHVRAEIDLEH